ncbi:adenylate kinase isoenzyme 6 [Tanacetum coccineum]
MYDCGLGRIALDDDDDVLDVPSLDSSIDKRFKRRRITLDDDDVLDVLSLDSSIDESGGTGKSTTTAALSEAASFRHINIGDFAKEKDLHEGWDDKLKCHVFNEDLVLDHHGSD